MPVLQWFLRFYESLCEALVVPLAGIEPALLAELDFESSASTSSATGAFALAMKMSLGDVSAAQRSGRTIAGGGCWSTRLPYALDSNGRHAREGGHPVRRNSSFKVRCLRLL